MVSCHLPGCSIGCLGVDRPQVSFVQSQRRWTRTSQQRPRRCHGYSTGRSKEVRRRLPPVCQYGNGSEGASEPHKFSANGSNDEEEQNIWENGLAVRSTTASEDEWKTLLLSATNSYDRVEGADEERMQQARTSSIFRATTSGRLQAGSLLAAWNDFWGRAAYQYFNWRRDTASDLLLFAAVNLALVLLGGFLKGTVVDKLDGALGHLSPVNLWANIYDILTVVLGQELPDKASSFVDQGFSLMVAAGGLAAFALVLALVEQVVLEVLDDRVKTGSPVYEAGHILVLGWLDNQRDEEVLWKLLSQICQAYRNDDGVVIVVLSQQPKLEMEARFRRIIPESQRFGTTFVFRQGSPLVPGDLRRVAAAAAKSVVVISDTSRSPEEADALSVRAAVLLDELDFPGYGKVDPRTGTILVELKTHNGMRLLRYSCSKRVQALPTAQANARRICRMVKSPVVGSISTMLFSFNSRSQAFVECFPELEGRTVAELPFYFPDGIVFGLVNHYSKKVRMNPPPGDIVEPGDEIMIIRPTSYRSGKYRPATQKKEVDIGDWSSVNYSRASIDEAPLGNDGSTFRAGLSGTPWPSHAEPPREGDARSGGFMLPLETPRHFSEPQLLIRELDRGPACLPRGSEVMFFNSRQGSEVLGRVTKLAAVKNLTFLHVNGNPLDQQDIRSKLDITRYKCAIFLCDQGWIDDGGGSDQGGVARRKEVDLLRLDAMILTAQLNIRQLLEESGFPEINLICEKVSFEGVTRFEDRYRLPLGISVNMSGFAATLMAEVTYNPKVLLPYLHLGEQHDMAIQDISAFAAPGEMLSFWQLQARVGAVGQVLYGFYNIPSSLGDPIDIVINPSGDEIRSLVREWNGGDSRRKIITMAPKLEVERDDSVSILTSPTLQAASMQAASMASMQAAAVQAATGCFRQH